MHHVKHANKALFEIKSSAKVVIRYLERVFCTKGSVWTSVRLARIKINQNTLANCAILAA